MKRETLTFLITPKTRAHRVLFDTDTPFTPKVVKSKKLFKRQPKHKKYLPEA